MAEIVNLKNPATGERAYPITKSNLVINDEGKNADELYAPKNDEVYNFAKEEYEKGLNLLNIPDNEIQDKGVLCSISKGVLTFSGTATGNWNLGDYYDWQIPAGTYSTSVFNNLAISSIECGFKSSNIQNYISLNSANATQIKATISSSCFYNVRIPTGTNVDGLVISPIIVKGDKASTNFYSYNQAQHIDNNEASLLKEEYEKSLNLVPLENKEYSGSFSTEWGSFNINLLQSFTLKAGVKYSWSAKLKSNNNCRMNKLGLTNKGETLIDMYDLGNLTSNYVTVSKTFTPTTDIVVDYIYVHNATVGSVVVKEIMVVEGDLKDYQPYYGEISRTGDKEQMFLKNEYEKSLNLIDVTTNNSGITNLPAYSPLIRGSIRLKANKKYTFSFLNIGSTIDSGQLYMNENLFDSSELSGNGMSGTYIRVAIPTNSTFNLQITPSRDIVVYDEQIMKCAATKTYNVTNVMLNEGSVVLPYQPYYGEICRRTNAISVNPQSNYDLNNLYDVGNYLFNGGTNAPLDTKWGTVLVLPYRKSTGNAKPDFATQIFLPNGDDTITNQGMFYRTSLEDSWNEWKEVATKGTLLWKNGNPNVSFSSQRITVGDMSKYTYIDIHYKPLYNSNEQTILVHRYAFNTSSTTNMNLFGCYTESHEQYIVGRNFVRHSWTEIDVGNCYRNQTVDNLRCIPIAIYGIK